RSVIRVKADPSWQVCCFFLNRFSFRPSRLPAASNPAGRLCPPSLRFFLLLSSPLPVLSVPEMHHCLLLSRRSEACCLHEKQEVDESAYLPCKISPENYFSFKTFFKKMP